MTPQKQRIAIAEACGWKWIRSPEQVAFTAGFTMPDKWVIDPHGTLQFPHNTPDYLNDLNAMHQVEKVIVPSSEYTLSSYMFELSKIVIPAGSTRRGLISEYIFHATAAQRAEAFLRTIGKWEESA